MSQWSKEEVRMQAVRVLQEQSTEINDEVYLATAKLLLKKQGYLPPSWMEYIKNRIAILKKIKGE